LIEQKTVSEFPMNRLRPLGRFLKRFHPEGIPWPAALLYNRISATGLFQEHYERVAQDILTYCSQGYLLDIGTGPGRLLMKLHSASPDMRLAGIDISPAMVDRARKNMESSRLSNVIEIGRGESAMIPFPDGTFDIVVSTGTIHHWKDPVGGLNEVYRVLKNDRYALMYDVVGDTPAYIMEQMNRKFGKFRTRLFWLHAFEEPFYKLAGFEQLAEETPFGEGKTRFVGMLCCLILKKEIPDMLA
jgi:ubiquinone/menaquinone biosynthesis C-methylase UbiE